MKFNFHVSPSLKGNLTTKEIMKELTLGLLLVFVLAVFYYASAYGSRYALQAILLLVCSLVTTLVCEFLFAKIRKRDPKKEIQNSFGWVTAIILTLTVTVITKLDLFPLLSTAS